MGQTQSPQGTNLNSESNTPTLLAESFDIERYLGTWYEISSFPLIWEIGCVRAVAQYGKVEGKDNSITVENTCVLKSGKTYSRKGIASLPEDSIDKDKF